ncbi:MAG: hypothetical protein HC854_04085 [Flavobacterium sp.]|nr:hypothetical protein [Flavobacterium sp.]
MKNIIIGIFCIGFIICDYIIEINPIVRNIIFGLMSIFVIIFLAMNRKENGLNKMFDDNKNREKNQFLMLKIGLKNKYRRSILAGFPHSLSYL